VGKIRFLSSEFIGGWRSVNREKGQEQKNHQPEEIMDSHIHEAPVVFNFLTLVDFRFPVVFHNLVNSISAKILNQAQNFRINFYHFLYVIICMSSNL
jgi:hypothetical protein